MGLGEGQGVRASVLSPLTASSRPAASPCKLGGDGVARSTAATPAAVARARRPSPTGAHRNVSFTSINAETKSVAAEFAAVIDSGTSYTYLSDPEYTELATNFNSLVARGEPISAGGSMTFSL
ncbi:unnamed protein product [Miscanthus lutarioriparius]|uniref:Peptidase A1 domain-containing protein n=1 Tax=Miscanthus lutarioriparius TaxID=422564 RepID=A0A811Q0Q3_9POAL|nr:unnamed protein product [Miscanthus lutarioriparius]